MADICGRPLMRQSQLGGVCDKGTGEQRRSCNSCSQASFENHFVLPVDPIHGCYPATLTIVAHQVNIFVYKRQFLACTLCICYFGTMEQKRSDIIANQIEELIFDGSFSDGERLDEVQLSERFSVSRTPVREALLRLAQSGLVEHFPRRGAFVRHPGPIELIEMFEVMAELEATSARFAASRISDAAINELKDVNERCNAAVLLNDTDGYYQENERFHGILYRESGNGFLEQECLRLQRRLQPFRRTQLRFRGRLQQSMQEHEAIVQALEDGDGSGAAEAIRNHVTVQGEKFHHLMSSLRAATA